VLRFASGRINGLPLITSPAGRKVNSYFIAWQAFKMKNIGLDHCRWLCCNEANPGFIDARGKLQRRRIFLSPAAGSRRFMKAISQSHGGR